MPSYFTVVKNIIGGGILTSLFAFRTIILALDTILGSQILFTNGYENESQFTQSLLGYSIWD